MEHDEANYTQSLKRLLCLCNSCHLATHFGFSELKGLSKQARFHIETVNKWPPELVDIHLEQAFEIWARRSRYNWKLDLGILKKAGITVVTPIV